MKKLLLLVGAAIGFVLGSKVGREPYERLEAQLRQLAGRPEDKGAVEAVSDKAANPTDTTAGVVRKTSVAKGPDQAEIDAETDAALDNELEGTFRPVIPRRAGPGRTSSPNGNKNPPNDQVEQPRADVDVKTISPPETKVPPSVM